MNVAVVASEAVPFAQTGGLADVAGSLPRALERLGVTVSLFLPRYRGVARAGGEPADTGLRLAIPVGKQTIEGTVRTTRLPGSDVRVYLIDQPGLFDRAGLYQDGGRDYPDNCERFVFFQRAVLETIRKLGLRPDVLHCNDWQTGLLPVYVAEQGEPFGTLFTIHNLAYQGIFPSERLAATGLGWRLFNWRQLEFHGRINFLKAGLVFADLLSTVSPTYAREIQTPELGCGLDGVLRARRDDLRGIVNGIDTDAWNPAREPMLIQNYNRTTVSAGKAACKAYLQRRAGLAERADVPLFAQIGRLVPQKGWDLLIDVADDLLRCESQLVVLGEGWPLYHDRLDRLAVRHPGKLRAFLGFSAPLAHQIQAGADLFLVPSLYEPCGLTQLHSLWHGTIPIARATGGLADTIVDATPAALGDGTATGFLFQEMTPAALRAAIDRARALWRDRPAWSRLVQSAMKADWSWDRSARAYLDQYEEVSRRARARATRRNAVGLAV